MTSQRPPRLDPAATRPRPPRPAEPDSAGTARVIAVAALVLAAVALGLTAWRLVAPGSAGCQTQAWDTAPKASDYPDAWTLSATQYDISRKTMSFVGPAPSDDSSAQAVIYATVSCYEQGAEDSVRRSAKAAQDAGQTVADRGDLGDGGFSALDNTGATFLQLRHDKIVVYLAASGDANIADVDQLASAFDKSLGGDGGSTTPPTPFGPPTSRRASRRRWGTSAWPPRPTPAPCSRRIRRAG